MVRNSVLLAFSLAAAPAAQPPGQPNVVLLMADDLGWGDVRFNRAAARARTPHLEAIARDSIVFDRFYAQSPVCSPTRASVLTGRHPARMAIHGANVGHLPRSETTLAELLRAQGYRTGHFGKWHLGTLTRDVADSNRGGPRGAEHYSPPAQHGFDVCFSTEAKVPTFDPLRRPASWRNRPEGRYAHRQFGWDSLTEDEPWTAYGTRYWNAAGEEEQAQLRGDDSALLAARAVTFIEDCVARRQPFLAVVWFHAPHLPVVASDADRGLYADAGSYRASYFGCITAMDRAVGHIDRALHRLGITDDTILAFTSDNGPEGDDNAPGSAGPFRGRKRSLLEGGVRVPGLLRWPARWPQGRRLRRLAACTVDTMPTIAAAVGVPIPASLRGTLDGIDLLPLIDADRRRPRGLGFVTHRQTAWHAGAFKLLSERTDTDWLWQLFDLDADPGETRDLRTAMPERTAVMRAALARWQAGLVTGEGGGSDETEPGSVRSHLGERRGADPGGVDHGGDGGRDRADREQEAAARARGVGCQGGV